MNQTFVSHTATLLPNCKVLVAGGVGGLIPPVVARNFAELYDPATGVWSITGNLNLARSSHTATLLPDGKVLAAAGAAAFTSAELFDTGLGFDPSWQPILTSITSPLLLGRRFVVSGSRFKGVSEASGGNGVQNSSSNYPLVELHSLVNEQTTVLLVDPAMGWSDTIFTSQPVTGLQPGYALVTVYTNGIPSASQVMLVLNEVRFPPNPISPFAVPALSEWGAIIMTVLFLTVAMIYIVRRRPRMD